MLRSRIAALLTVILAVAGVSFISAPSQAAQPSGTVMSAVKLDKRAGGFTCHDGRNYASAYYYHLQGSNGRVAYQFGTNSATGKRAVRVWVPSGGSAKHVLADYPRNTGVVIQTEGFGYELCLVIRDNSGGVRITSTLNGNRYSEYVPL